MIKVNELRIGNLVDYEKTTHIVTGIVDDLLYSRWHKQSQSEVDYRDYYRNYEPIPLTPEILEKCGFVKDENNFKGLMDVYSLPIPAKGSNENIISFHFPLNKEVTPFGRYFVNGYHGSNNFEYVHEFQNLYFSLTGEELQLNL